MMKSTISTGAVFLAILIASSSPLRAKSESIPIPDSTIWPRAVVLPKPLSTSGVKQAVISLGGDWKLNVAPPIRFCDNSVDPASWRTVYVPADLQAQDLNIPVGHEYAYKRKIEVPVDFAGKGILIRFEGVTGQARVWVNGDGLPDLLYQRDC